MSRSARASAGRPSTRSPMMLPCTWSEPPAMRSDGECRNFVVHTPPAGAASGSASIAGGALDVHGRRGHLLHEAGVGQLHHRRLRPGPRALGQRGLRPQPEVAQQLAAQVRLDHRLADQRVVRRGRARWASAMSPGGSAPPEPPAMAVRSLARVVCATRHPSPTSPSTLADRDAHLVEEHLAEVGVAGHLAQRPDVDARASPCRRGSR